MSREGFQKWKTLDAAQVTESSDAKTHKGAVVYGGIRPIASLRPEGIGVCAANTVKMRTKNKPHSQVVLDYHLERGLSRIF